MTVEAAGPATDPRWVEWSGGLSWLAHLEEGMRRASHAIRVDGTPADAPGGREGAPVEDASTAEDPVVVVEPLDAAGLDDRLAELGTVAGVVVLSEYHRRDGAAVARRHGVPVYVPGPVEGSAGPVDAPVRTFEGELGATGFRALALCGDSFWGEAVLYRPADGTLVTAEALVTAPDMRRPGERLAVIPYVRPFPPRAALSDLDVERVLVGHGPPVLADADEALSAALSDARRGAPAAVLGNLPYLLRAMIRVVRD